MGLNLENMVHDEMFYRVLEWQALWRVSNAIDEWLYEDINARIFLDEDGTVRPTVPNVELGEPLRYVVCPDDIDEEDLKSYTRICQVDRYQNETHGDPRLFTDDIGCGISVRVWEKREYPQHPIYEVYIRLSKRNGVVEPMMDFNLTGSSNNMKQARFLHNRLTKVVEDIIQISEVLGCPPGTPTEDRWIDIIDKTMSFIRMEISSARASQYNPSQMSIDDFLKLDIDDVNYNSTIYHCRDQKLLDEIEEKMHKEWMLNRMYRFENVRRNGYFGIENCDLQDVSECGYDRIDYLCTGDNAYKLVEILGRGEAYVQSSEKSD